MNVEHTTMKRLTDEEIKAMPVDELQRLIAEQQFHIYHLRSEIARLRHDLFGKRSEKLSGIDKEQSLLFNEIESGAKSEEEELQSLADRAPLFVREHTRKKPGRRPLPSDLPRREILHDLADDEKICTQHGVPLPHIGDDVSERLHIIPMQVEVERHIRPKYGQCPECRKSRDAIAPDARPEVKMAPAPATLIPGSIATAALLAYIITGKFCDALPFYRLEKIFARSGVELTRATMCFWAIRIAAKTVRLRKLLWDELRRAKILHIDETTIQVLKEPQRKPTTQSYLWGYRSGGAKPIVLFEYRMTRSGEFLRKRLRGFSGTFMADGYAGYDYLGGREGITRIGCWAHVRRKYFEAEKSGSAEAGWFLMKIRDLYLIESKARNSTPEERRELRQQYSRLIIEEIHAKIHNLRATMIPESHLGKAMSYTLNQWKYLLPFLENGELPIDNNAMENDIRPFVVGRKNWLFAAVQKGAAASAFLYSLIQTAKANGHEPFWYLRYLFEKLPEAGGNKEALRALLPMNVSSDEVDRHFGRQK